MLDNLEPEVLGRVRKLTSSVQFRFGNSGTLRSLFALCLPRQQKGWIRVEVVPGQTPFLVSNAVLRELGVLIDPRNQVLRFLDDPKIVPLKPCRKNLLCVHITDLLSLGDYQSPSGDEIFHNNTEMQTNKTKGIKDTENWALRNKSSCHSPRQLAQVSHRAMMLYR